MRAARLGDLRRDLDRRNRNASPIITRLRFTSLPGFHDTALEPDVGFLAICGGTGLGKTALLELFHLSVEARTEGDPGPVRSRLGSATVSVTVALPGGPFERTTTASIPAPADDDGFPNGVQFVGLAQRTSNLQDYFCANDVEVLKEGVEPQIWSDTELAAVSAVCRKNYTSVTAYEIDQQDDVVIPFFEVREGDVTYDSRSMATGELSALYLAWTFRSAVPYSLVLIEEPEAYLPPLSHSAVFALIGEATLAKRLCVVVTTHSAAIAAEIPERNLMSVRRVSGRSALPTGRESKVRVLDRLGLGPQRSAVLFVEDDLAADILREILGIYEFNVVSNIEIVVSGDGFGGVRRALDNLPTSITSVRFLGILDGDMRDQISDWDCQDQLLFLPFKTAMEKELLEAADRLPAKFAELAGRGRQRVEDLLEATRGLDHHDRFSGIAAGLEMQVAKLSGIALARWARTSSKKAAAQAFARELASKLGVSLP